MIKKAINFVRAKMQKTQPEIMTERYINRFEKYSFIDCQCESLPQFEASAIRLYHTIEKGLSYEDYRAGFGRDNVEKLIMTLEQYSDRGYDIGSFFYETALSCLQEYVRRNKESGLNDDELEKRIHDLPGKANDLGGAVRISKPTDTSELTFRELISKRRSVRHFSDVPVSEDDLKDAIGLAQNTPSACNRQGWKTRIIKDKNVIKKVLDNQNGNRGFGHEFDSLLAVTSDLCAQQRDREIFQAFIDGGMYAQNILNALYSKGIASVPLSAALTAEQEENIRSALGVTESEVFILFIGVGNYPDGEFLTTRSERKQPEIEVI